MEALWNKFDLNRPPTNSWRPSPGEFDTTHFICEINKCLKDSSLQNTLHTEAALLSRLIYRMKWKFRNDKGFKNMEKINRSLLNYLHLSIEKEFDYLKDNIVIDKNNILLPSKQMLDYVLVKIQGFAKLMCKIKSTCMDAAKFFKSRINIGHAWTTSLIAYSVISRLWKLSQDYVKQCCDWYRNLYMYRDKLKCVGVNWLPSNYTFPLDLKAWLSVEWEEQNDKCPIKEDLTSSILTENKIPINADLLTVSDLGQKISREHFTSEANKTAITKVQNQVNSGLFSVPDLGQKILRKSDTSEVELKELPIKNMKKKSKTNFKSIKTREDLDKLLSLDSYPGLDKLQWNIIRKKVNKAMVKLDKYPSDNIKNKLHIEKIIKFLQSCIN